MKQEELLLTFLAITKIMIYLEEENLKEEENYLLKVLMEILSLPLDCQNC